MKKLHVKHKNEGTGCVEGTVSRREISALCSLSFSLCANILWLLQLHWCRLRWTGQIDWSSPVVVAMAPVAPGNEARGVQMCSSPVCTYMDVMCVHVCVCVKFPDEVRVYVISIGSYIMLPVHYYWGLLSDPHIACYLFFVFFICINWSLVWKMLITNGARKNWNFAYLLQFVLPIFVTATPHYLRL